MPFAELYKSVFEHDIVQRLFELLYGVTDLVSIKPRRLSQCYRSFKKCLLFLIYVWVFLLVDGCSADYAIVYRQG